eukprot:INCI15801.2.p1 GENE.INCI15801.2~~INCI15801.2.p1  ORF type:complete len:555 (+),score=70.55 INCI15801.2:316-1980(+)
MRRPSRGGTPLREVTASDDNALESPLLGGRLQTKHGEQRLSRVSGVELPQGASCCVQFRQGFDDPGLERSFLEFTAAGRRRIFTLMSCMVGCVAFVLTLCVGVGTGINCNVSSFGTPPGLRPAKNHSPTSVAESFPAESLHSEHSGVGIPAPCYKNSTVLDYVGECEYMVLCAVSQMLLTIVFFANAVRVNCKCSQYGQRAVSIAMTYCFYLTLAGSSAVTGWLFPEQQLQQPSSVSALVAPLFAMIFDAPVDQFTVASLLFIVVYNAAIVSWWQYQWELTTAGHFDIESFDHAVSLVHDAAQHVLVLGVAIYLSLQSNHLLRQAFLLRHLMQEERDEIAMERDDMEALAKPFSPGELERWFTSKCAERIQRQEQRPDGSSAPSVLSHGARVVAGQNIDTQSVHVLGQPKDVSTVAKPSRDLSGASPITDRQLRQGTKARGKSKSTESFDSSASGSSATSSVGFGSMPHGRSGSGEGHSRPVVYLASNKPKARRGSPATRSWDLNTDDLVLGPIIAAGAAGTVAAGTYNGLRVAVKVAHHSPMPGNGRASEIMY